MINQILKVCGAIFIFFYFIGLVMISYDAWASPTTWKKMILKRIEDLEKQNKEK